MNLPAGIRPGDIGLVGRQPGEGLLDRFFEENIQWFTDSPVNHAFVYVGGGSIVEAVRRVSVSPASNYTGIEWSTGRLPDVDNASPRQRRLAVDYAIAQVGDSYNIAGLLAVGLYQRRTGHLVRGDEWWVKLLNAERADFCSELVAKAWLAAGVTLFPGQLPVTVSPGEIYRLYTSAYPGAVVAV